MSAVENVRVRKGEADPSPQSKNHKLKLSIQIRSDLIFGQVPYTGFIYYPVSDQNLTLLKKN
jgi:hypothetical protein